MTAVPLAPLSLAPPRARADRAFAIACGIVAAFLLAGLWPLVRWTRLETAAAPLDVALVCLVHVAALGLALWAAVSPRAPRLLRAWLPLAAGPWLYVEMRWLIAGAGRLHADAAVVAWERALFPSDPSATWASRHPSLALSETLHLCYLSYYALVALPPLLLAWRRRRDDVARTMLSLAVVYAACFTAYLVFPVDGPRYLVGPAAAPDGPVRRLVLAVLAGGSSRGTAFPSSHVAAALVASLCVWSAHRALGAGMLLVTAGLALGTVYGGYHYAVDALAGATVGSASWAVATIIWRSLGAAGSQSATDTA